MYENIRLQTRRLLLRPVSPDDLSTVYTYSSDGEHVKYMKYYPDESMEVCKKFLIQTCEEWSKEFPRCYVFAVIQNNRHIGEVSVYAEDEAFTIGELGWIIHRDYCNKGYASEATQALLSFCQNTLHLNKVTACCDSRNSASIKIMETLGMTVTKKDIPRKYLKRNETAFEIKTEKILHLDLSSLKR